MNKKSYFVFFFIVALICKCYCIYFHYTPYSGTLREIKTEHFIVVFPKKYESVGRLVSTYAEDAYDQMTSFYKWKPIWRTTIILSDESDSPNGLATSALRNTIVLYLTPSQADLSLSGAADYLWTLVVHEFSHILHLDQIRGDGWFWRGLFGKLYLPNSGTFTWDIEGLATFTESKFSNAGRLRSNYHHAIIAAAAINHSLPDYDRLLSSSLDFPAGQAVYHFGASFLEYLYNTYGEEKFQSIYLEISKDFFPFILRFVLNFKKIYGKSLDDLWEEWKIYEQNKYSSDLSDDMQRHDFIQITNTKSKILSFVADQTNENLYYFANGYPADRFIMSSNLQKKSKNKKMLYGYATDMALQNDYLFFVKEHSVCDGKEKRDLYSYNLKNKVERQLTYSGKVNFVTTSTDKIAFVKNSVLSTEIIVAQTDKGKITKQQSLLVLPDFSFVSSLAFNQNGDKLVITTINKDGCSNVYLYDFQNLLLQDFGSVSPTLLISNAKCSSIKWLNDDKLCFLHSVNYHNDICSYDIATETTSVLYSNKATFPFKIQPVGDKIYYLGYTHKGMEVFYVDIPQNARFDTNYDVHYRDDGYFDDKVDTKRFNSFGMRKPQKVVTQKSTVYHFGRYLYPTIWAVIPEMLSSTFFNVPFIAPKLMFIMESPTGRMTYTGSITYDYLKQYPQNDFSLSFNLPCTTIGLNWKNWAGGTVTYDNNGFHSIGTINGLYSINFSDGIYINPFFVITDYLQIGLYASVNHTFNQWSISNYDIKTKTGDIKYFQNTLNFVEKFTLQLFYHKPGSSRINRGLFFDVTFYQAPEQILNNNISTYLINAKLQFMIPFCNTYYFGLLQGGSEIYSYNNMYSVNSSLYKILQSVPSIMGNSSLNVIDGKAFGNFFYTQQKVNGFAYISYDSGFDITLYNKSHYWHFATLGFKELFMRVYNQYIYLFAQKQTFDHFFVDTVLELTLKLLVGYDRYCFELSVGAAVGYQGNATKPSWGVFFSFNATVGN